MFTNSVMHSHMIHDILMLSADFLRRNPFSATVQILALSLCCIFSLLPDNAPAKELFPRYPSIRANVEFWEKVYSTYSVNSAVIHDRTDLSKVYEVVRLVDRKLPYAGRVNGTIIDAAIEKYQTILGDLAGGKAPSTAAERRVALMFRGSHARQNALLAKDNVRAQIGQKEQFYAGVVRSGGYMATIRQIFMRHGLPPELAYLPHVESSFNTEAYSKAGAAGIWQFTPDTGKQYLRIDDTIDERSDPFIAADAAAKYLRNSYEKLGSWPLALTAYNYGTAGMMRAQDAKGSYERIFLEYREGHFGFASQNFYSEFLAAIKVAKMLESSPRVQRDQPLQYAVYVLPGYIHLKDIKHHFSVSDDALKELNPAIRPAVYSGSRLLPQGYRLRLPVHANTRALASRLPKSSLHRSQTQDRYHQVKAGENLGRIAARHGVSLKALLAANGLRDNDKIRVGQRLRIPPKTAAASPGKSSPATLAAEESKRFPTAKLNRSTTGATRRTVRIFAVENSKIERLAAR